MSKILISNDYFEVVFMPSSWALPLFVCASHGSLTVQIFCLWMGFELENIGKYLKEFMED